MGPGAERVGLLTPPWSTKGHAAALGSQSTHNKPTRRVASPPVDLCLTPPTNTTKPNQACRHAQHPCSGLVCYFWAALRLAHMTQPQTLPTAPILRHALMDTSSTAPTTPPIQHPRARVFHTATLRPFSMRPLFSRPKLAPLQLAKFVPGVAIERRPQCACQCASFCLHNLASCLAP